MQSINTALLSGTAADTARFATLVHAQLRVDAAGATVALLGAGHPPPPLVSGGNVEFVGTAGTLLGVYPDLTFAGIDVRLRPGDSLVLYTDGVTEGRSAAGFYGADRPAAAVGRCADGAADDIAEALLTDVTEFQHGRLHDDVAILVLRAAP